MIDTHCHLYLDEFKFDIDEVISEAKNKGVNRILVPGIDINSSKASLELSGKFPGEVFTAVGIHPNYSVGSNASQIERLIRENRDCIFAIGEIGLDYYRDYAPRNIQIKLFEEQLEIANMFDLPICIHNRNAEEDMVRILDNWVCVERDLPKRRHRGVFHAYNGDAAIAEWGINHNFLFGIDGPLTYKNSIHLREAVKEIGVNHLVLETDAPYLSPVPFRGKRNDPKNLAIILEALADLLECSEDHVEGVTDANAEILFGLNKKCQQNGILF